MKFCKICGKSFKGNSNGQKICDFCNIKKCIVCNKTFRIYLYDSNRITCSKSCNLKFQHLNGICIGFKSGKENPAYLRKGKTFDEIFGQEKSRNIRIKLGHAGSKNPMWKGGIDQTIYRKFLKESCEICNNVAKIVHHKDKNRKNNEISNLLSVCHRCHHKIHYQEMHNWRKSNGK